MTRSDEILAVLRGVPEGLTSDEIRQRIGAWATYNVSSLISKLAAYGKIDKVKPAPGKTRWRAKP